MKREPEPGAMIAPEEVDAYDRTSKKYLKLVEKKFVKRVFNLLAQRKLLKEPLVLDVGTGTANIPIRFVHELSPAHFIAMDKSITMLKKARSNINDIGLRKRINLVCADAESLPFKEDSCDLVYSHSTIHHLVDPLKAIGEMVRVTGKGCQFIIRDLRRPPAFLLEFYVRIFGLGYDELTKKMYRESLRAGFTYKEMKNLARQIQNASVRARRFFITHVGLEGVCYDSGQPEEEEAEAMELGARY
jgi:ubiquinone/menaquinone biosynthesis C-methylase UbiE